MPQIVCVLKTVRENDLVALNPQIVQRRICSKDARRAARAFDGRLQMTLPLVVPLEIAEVLRIVFQEFEVVLVSEHDQAGSVWNIAPFMEIDREGIRELQLSQTRGIALQTIEGRFVYVQRVGRKIVIEKEQQHPA